MRALRLLPHALTLGNLMAGTLAIGFIIAGHPLWHAALLVGLALVCDLFDGRAARALGTDAAFGAQLDSLSDLVSFGVAPALALHTWKLAELGPLGTLAAGTLVAAAATRLARFTVAAGQKPADAEPAPKPSGPARFSGLAVTIPAAIALGATAADLPLSPAAAGLLAVALAGLMVSRIPYRSFKDRPALVVVGPALAILALAIVALQSPVAGFGFAFALGGAAYALSGPVSAVKRRARARLSAA